jgi:hypothetical protein
LSEDHAVSHLAYPLRDGFVVNWLVAGSLVSSDPLGWDDDPGIEGAPVERGPLGTGTYHAGTHSGTWTYYACPDDHVVDCSGTYPAGHSLRSWAYAELVADAARTVAVTLTASGPAGLWLDGTLVLRLERGSTTAQVQLRAGANRVLVRFDAVAAGETTHTAALRIESVEADDLRVQLPTLIENVGRRTAFEALTAGTFLERDVYQGGTSIALRWPTGERAFCPAHVRLHGADDAIYALADVAGEPGDTTELGYALQLPHGPMRVTLMPSPDEVYLHNTRITHDLPFLSLGRQRYAATPDDSDLAARRNEALLAVAEYGDSVYGQIARVALGAWDDVDASVIVRACERPDEAVLLALVGMLHRFGTREEGGARAAGQGGLEAPDAETGHGLPTEVSQAVERAILSYDQWSAPGPEASRIQRHAAELLAGHLFPDRTFVDGHDGTWHRANGERLALAWMTELAARGSAQPGAGHVIEQEAAALAYLADLAESPAVYELAAVCLDKLLFLLALHLRQGVLGAASPSTPASFVKSGLLQPTAPISRLLWGTGIYNHHLAGALGLALATSYESPAILAAIAHDSPAELWSREYHAPTGAEPASLVTYKTPEYVLSSLADLRPGEAGHREQIWRATFSPEAVVFVNQPGASSESDSRLPGYWAGNARLPRVGQWRDALIAMHRVDETDSLPWTHAYFPCATFDEYLLREGWAFARVGDGYLALRCSTGFTLTTEGRYAERELRASGSAPTWLVQMGRAALDGDLQAFQAQVLAAPYTHTSESVHWTTIRGDVLQIAWSGPFSVNGVSDASGVMAQQLHIDSAYARAELPCTSMDISLHDDLLRLDFMTP